jgi:DeoR/GlpR family transcriptional regulator of sugar metabolism
MKEKRGEIIQALVENSSGFTVSELSKKLRVSRQTVSNNLAFLEGAKKVRIRQAGMAKIYFWKEKNEKV